MKNSVTATIEFSFRGKSYTPSIRIDLDPVMKNHGSVAIIYDMIAHSIGLDAYSYEYDILTMEDIVYSDPEGPISAYIHNGALDMDGFTTFWLEQKVIETVQPIAEKHLSIENLDNHPELKAALVESYRSGQRDPENKIIDHPLL